MDTLGRENISWAHPRFAIKVELSVIISLMLRHGEGFSLLSLVQIRLRIINQINGIEKIRRTFAFLFRNGISLKLLFRKQFICHLIH